MKTLAYIVCLTFCACSRKELPLPKYDRGTASSSQISMNSNYTNQVWYKLADNKATSTNSKYDWDLGFENSAEGWHVVLNSAKGMRAALITGKTYESIIDTVGFGSSALADVPSGNLDSTAVGNWKQNQVGHTYIIFLGYNDRGRGIGYCKLQLLQVEASTYIFKYADLKTLQNRQVTLIKNQQSLFTQYSLITHQTLNIQPPSHAYDLCFTSYTTIFYNPFMYYQVSGVLSNRNTRVMRLAERDFQKVTIADTLGGSFSTKADAIGYDWKSYDLNTNLYTTYHTIIYIIQDQSGYYYKLHFTDFYNELGEKGHPNFEYQKL